MYGLRLINNFYADCAEGMATISEMIRNLGCWQSAISGEKWLEIGYVGMLHAPSYLG